MLDRAGLAGVADGDLGDVAVGVGIEDFAEGGDVVLGGTNPKYRPWPSGLRRASRAPPPSLPPRPWQRRAHTPPSRDGFPTASPSRARDHRPQSAEKSTAWVSTAVSMPGRRPARPWSRRPRPAGLEMRHDIELAVLPRIEEKSVDGETIAGLSLPRIGLPWTSRICPNRQHRPSARSAARSGSRSPPRPRLRSLRGWPSPPAWRRSSAGAAVGVNTSASLAWPGT